MLQNAVAAAKKVGMPEDRVILMGDEREKEGRFKHFTSIRNTSGTQRYRRAKVDPAKDLAFLVYSSGTVSLAETAYSHDNMRFRDNTG